jgi:MHS family proline/betaine transporter-like MFS transporter
MHPLKILKAKLFIFLPVVLLSPYLLSKVNSPIHIFLLQSFFMLFVLSTNPATPIFYKHIPIFKRFTYGSMIYAISRALMHIITSFGIVYCEKYFGNWGILLVIVTMVIGYGFGIFYFVGLEKESGSYPVKALASYSVT